MKCKKCKRVPGGGAAIRFGLCRECKEQVNTVCGVVPVLCKTCSENLNQCIQCGIDIP